MQWQSARCVEERRTAQHSASEKIGSHIRMSAFETTNPRSKSC
jgi:hypothetical protein